jgi:crotonobetainyl-CoA:carnitine CoA-transferase CaiB-like acyl-CoA transferase
VRCGYGVTDVTAGMYAVIGILLALHVRESTGLGQFVDVAMQDGMISTMSSNYMGDLVSGIVPQPMGTLFPPVVPYCAFHTKDRDISIAVGSEKLWSAFCRVIERLDLEKHPDYETNATRIRNRTALHSVLAEVFMTRGVEDWLRRLQPAGIPCSLVRNFQEVVSHPQCEVRQMFPVLDHPMAGAHRVTGSEALRNAGTPDHCGAAAGRTHEIHAERVLRSRRCRH